MKHAFLCQLLWPKEQRALWVVLTHGIIGMWPLGKVPRKLPEALQGENLVVSVSRTGFPHVPNGWPAVEELEQ